MISSAKKREEGKKPFFFFPCFSLSFFVLSVSKSARSTRSLCKNENEPDFVLDEREKSGRGRRLGG